MNNIPIKIRLNSIYVDNRIFSIIGVVLFTFFSLFSSSGNTEEVNMDATSLVLNILVPISLVYTLFFNKDIINARSYGKKCNNLVVISLSTNALATPVQCFIRNLTIIIWPIEIIMILFQKDQRRIGDLLANTKVDYWTDQIEKPDYQAQIKYVLGFSLMACVLLIAFSTSLNNMIAQRNQIPKTNHSAQLSDILYQNLTQKIDKKAKKIVVNVYLPEGETGSKFFTIFIDTVNENTVTHPESIEESINAALNESFGAGNYNGQCKILYRTEHSYSSRQFRVP